MYNSSISQMGEQFKKSHSQIISSSPFLLRFTGKLNQLSKQGTMTHQSLHVDEEGRKNKTAILEKSGENSLMSLEQIRHRKQGELQSKMLHSSVRSAEQSSAYRKSDHVTDTTEFLKSVLLRGKNISADFQDMLTLLNKVEHTKHLR